MTPPDEAIEQARTAALQSPCLKSRRGVVIFDPGRMGLVRWIATGHNAPPDPFMCDGTDACRRDCGKICVHAEQAAIREALAETWDGGLRELELLHVKVVDGKVAPGSPPSCWQCSREILDARLAGVWLYEAQRWHDEIPCESCSAITIVAQGAGTTGVCESCKAASPFRRGLLEFGRTKTVYAQDSGEWRFYTAVEFHEATLKNCGLHVSDRRP